MMMVQSPVGTTPVGGLETWNPIYILTSKGIPPGGEESLIDTKSTIYAAQWQAPISLAIIIRASSDADPSGNNPRGLALGP